MTERMRGVLSPVVVGRDQEVSHLDAVVKDARGGRGGLIALAGEAGVGKSRLAREAKQLATLRGAVAFSGRAVAGGGPFGALTSAFVSYGRRHGLPSDPQLQPFRAALGSVMPDWRTTSDAPAVPPAHAGPLVAEALIRLLRVAAPDGALLVLEDLHWSDPETLEVLDCLADSLADQRLACLVTLREDEPTAASRWLSALCARRAGRRIGLERLSRDETLAVARASLGTSSLPRELEAFVVDNAEGLPLLIEDLLAELVSSDALTRSDDGAWAVAGPLSADVPTTFAETVQRRLSQLDDATTAMVSAAAVVGRRFDWTLVAAMTRYADVEVLAALRAAVQRQIVTADPVAGAEHFRFRHALTRDVVLSGLLPPERSALAHAAATAIETQHPGLPGEWCTVAARLYAEGGANERAAQLLLEAARRALARGALTSAEATLRRARAVAPSPALADAVDAALTRTLALAGKVDDAFGVGEALLGRLDPADDARARAEVRLQLARAAATATRWQRARSHLDAVGPGSGDDEQAIRAQGLRAVVAIGEGSVTEAGRLGWDVLARAERTRLWDVACETLEVLGRCARLGDRVEAERRFERAYRVADEHGSDLWRLRALHELGTIDLFETGRTKRLQAAWQLASATGAAVTAAHVDLHLGLLLAHRDEPDAARQHLERAVTTAARLRLGGFHHVALAQLGYALALAGLKHDAIACIERALSEAPGGDARVLADGLAAGFVRLLDDDRRGAIAKLDAVVPLLTDGTWPHWGVRALLRAVEGDSGDAAIADGEVAGGRGEPNRFNRAYLGFARAVLAGRAGHDDQAQAAFTEADAQLGWQAAHRRFCWRQVAEAAVTDDWGEPVSWLRQVLPAFEQRGAVAVASACRGLLRRAGAPVPRRRRGDPPVPARLRAHGITHREAEVLALVAEGRANPEIAAQLHLSRRTVESHVSSLLMKTGTTTRHDLARLLDP